MKVIENSIIPPKGFAGINLFGVLFIRKGVVVSERMIRHEAIHTEQMKDLLFVPFYLIYVIEWLVKLLFYASKAYRNVSFEREAYANDNDVNYLSTRKRFSFLKYM